MTVLIVPELEDDPWPSLGGQVCDFIEDRAVFGPGSLKGQRARLDAEKRAAVWRAYEVYPKGHELEGRRRFRRVGLSWRKGTAKTEFAAWLAFAELHPDGPVRFGGWDAAGNPVGRPVADPYIPMVAFTEEQVEELAYGALYVVVTEGPDADLFDAGLDRILRLDDRGRADGKAEALAGSPNARDGARTTFQHFDEPHRMYLPKLVQAHETMLGNLPKRPLEDPWSLETTTAGQPGQGSVAEKTHTEAEQIAAGLIEEPELFYFHREAGPSHDLDTLEGRIEAVSDATGPVGEFGPGQFRDIARQWDRNGADKAYLERVWLNRWVQSSAQAFDPNRWDELATAERISPGSFITLGFDGARFRDATALVATEIPTGVQMLVGLWERPPDVDDWEVPEDDVSASVAECMDQFDVWRLYADPPHWTETVGAWATRWPDHVVEWWTNHKRRMALAARSFREAMDSGAVTHDGNPLLARHVAAAGRRDTTLVDEDGAALFLLTKQHEERKFDAAMAAVLSWAARLDALRAGAQPSAGESFVPRRIR